MAHTSNAPRERTGEEPRRPYRAPELIEYGSVAKLTQGALTVGSDGAMGGFKNMMCL